MDGDARSAMPYPKTDPNGFTREIFDDLIFRIELTGNGRTRTIHANKKGSNTITASVSPGLWVIKAIAYYRAETFLYAESEPKSEKIASGTNTINMVMNKAHYNIGEDGQGGIVFYVADGREGRPFGFKMADTGEICHYLEVNYISSPFIKWCGCETPPDCYGGIPDLPIIAGNIGTDSPNKDILDTIGQGRRNTNLIIAYHDNAENDYSNNAAIYCDVHEINDYEDWFLPSIGELYLLYQNKETIGMTGTTVYWSSSQFDNSRTWFINFGSGLRSDGYRNSNGYVCPIRAF